MIFSSIFTPMLIQIVLTLILFIILAIRKSKSVKAGTVDRKLAALNNSAWPDDIVKVSNNIANQFQTPNLFFILCFLFYLTNNVSSVVLAFAWVYVISRIVHAYIHINSNFVPARLKAFLIGVVCIIVMTVIAFIKLGNS